MNSVPLRQPDPGSRDLAIGRLAWGWELDSAQPWVQNCDGATIERWRVHCREGHCKRCGRAGRAPNRRTVGTQLVTPMKRRTGRGLKQALTSLCGFVRPLRLTVL